jgi:Flp pilus assembly protein TadG
MAMLRTKRSQAAQGMVEFALVLPILLLLLLGIIAFGHLFFVYSFTVASSREAARWGAAVGVTDAGKPRYQDCASIREAARRVGGIIGVTPAAVSISFDRGPGNDPYATCPVGGEGPEVALGDRILVTVDITYQPIVPLVNLPTIPLQGTTARTIIKNLPVGDAPTAKPICYQTVPGVTATSSPLDVNVWETFSYNVLAKNASDPNPTASDGYVDIYVDGTKLTLTKAISGTFKYDFGAVYGTHEIEAVFTSSKSSFCSSSETYNFFVRIPSKINFLSDAPDPSISDEKFTVQLEVLPSPSGVSDIPTGTVTVADSLDAAVSCTITLDSDGKGSCDFLDYKYTGARTLTATYSSDAIFGPSQASETHTVTAINTPTLIPSPTMTPTKTPIPTATPPVQCPSVGTSYDFDTMSNAFFLQIDNNNSWLPVTITGVNVQWPSKPGSDALLQEIRLVSAKSQAQTACDVNAPAATCLWNTKNPLSPENKFIGDDPNANPDLYPFWSSPPIDATIAAYGTKQLGMVFLGNVPSTQQKDTKYMVTINFMMGNGTTCQVTGPAERKK